MEDIEAILGPEVTEFFKGKFGGKLPSAEELKAATAQRLAEHQADTSVTLAEERFHFVEAVVDMLEARFKSPLVDADQGYRLAKSYAEQIADLAATFRWKD